MGDVSDKVGVSLEVVGVVRVESGVKSKKKGQS